MIPGTYRKEKIGVIIVGAYPSAVKPHAGRDRTSSESPVTGRWHVRKYVNQTLARFGLRRRVLRLIGLHPEIDLLRAATSSGARDRRIILRKDRGSQKKHQEEDSDHVSKTPSPPT
jgi:hypothetical protein